MKHLPKLILVTGLQKSGTSLLLRLLVNHTELTSPFDGIEGHSFWGNVPSHAPKQFPTGTIYLRSQGRHGHEISADDADQQMKRILCERLAGISNGESVVVNKSPYHTVRLPWLKKVFPECVIVSTIRQPVPNIFSMLKKYQRRDEGQRPWREDGWYGVKPRGWRKMRDDDALIQCANQWRAVMSKLWNDRANVDQFFPYSDLCSQPAEAVKRVLELAGLPQTTKSEFPKLKCYDDEYQTGSALRSKNEVDCLEPSETEPIETPPFTDQQIEIIRDRCGGFQNWFA